MTAQQIMIRIKLQKVLDKLMLSKDLFNEHLSDFVNEIDDNHGISGNFKDIRDTLLQLSSTNNTTIKFLSKAVDNYLTSNADVIRRVE